MVKIINGWELHTNSYGYILQYNTGKTVIDKDGNESVVYTKTRYPKDIQHALKIVKREIIIDRIQNNEMILSDLIDYLDDLENRFDQLLKDIIKE